MTRSEHLLTCLAEECAEISQRVSKALRFGLSEVQPGQGQTNAQRIVTEWVDLLGVIELLRRDGILNIEEIDEAAPAMIAAKGEKIERYMAISREQGVLS